MPFSDFPKSPLDIVGPDGVVRASTEGVVASSTQIVIFDTTIHVEPGDEVRRSLPNGYDETYDVRDAVYHDGMGGIPSFYSIKTARKGSYPKGTGGHYIHLTGANARVNLNSTDNSTNTVVHGPVFGDLRAAIHTGVADPLQREALTSAVARLEAASAGADKLDAYSKLIAAGANHMTLLAPFLPALAALLTPG
jgi:hypothetical protein